MSPPAVRFLFQVACGGCRFTNLQWRPHGCRWIRERGKPILPSCCGIAVSNLSKPFPTLSVTSSSCVLFPLLSPCLWPWLYLTKWEKNVTSSLYNSHPPNSPRIIKSETSFPIRPTKMFRIASNPPPHSFPPLRPFFLLLPHEFPHLTRQQSVCSSSYLQLLTHFPSLEQGLMSA